MFDKDPFTAIEAVTAAQWLAFAPLAFQATSIMRDRGILSTLATATPLPGCSLEEVAQASGLSAYGTTVLLEAGLGLHIVLCRDHRYFLGRLGQFLLNDEMTRVNFDFTRDVCYRAAAHLETALLEGRPEGLKELGPWPTVYEGLSALPEPALGSWHAFDQFYSSRAFDVVIETLVSESPQNMLDIGCNTGKWARLCLTRLPELKVGLVDLPLQLDEACKYLTQAGVIGQVQLHPLNLLCPQAVLPKGYKLLWMSQFLDCFSEDQIVTILGKARDALPEGGKLWILELFWDRQRFEAAAFSIQQTSLYFSCVANGNSKMYESPVFFELIERAGLQIIKLTDGLGGYHTLVECCATGIKQ
jgi:hypothetical protein